MDILSNLLWTLKCLTIIYTVKGFSGGYFPTSCIKMDVLHEWENQMLSPHPSLPPFEIQSLIVDEDLITVTLLSTDSTPFKGFMLEARNNDDRIVGKFILTDPKESRLLDCNGSTHSAVSQTRDTRKYQLRVNWTSGTKDLNVTFRATFLEDYYRFWSPMDHVNPTPEPSTTPSTSIPTTEVTVLSTAESTTEHTTSQTTELSTTKHSTGTTIISTNPELTSTTVVSSTTPPHATDDSVSASVNTKRPRLLEHIEKYTPEVTAEVSLGTFTITLPAIIASNAKNHKRKKWVRRCGSMLVLVLEITAFVLLFFYDKLLNLKLIALSMSIAGAVTLVLSFWDIGRSHELWPLYDNVIDVFFLIQKGLAIAFIYCCTSNCQSWLLYVLISFTVWVSLQIIHIVTVKILRLIGSGYKKEIDQKQKCQVFGAAVSTVLNVVFCVAIIVGICQC